MNRIFISDLIFFNKTFEEIESFLKKNEQKNFEFFVEPKDKEKMNKLKQILLRNKFGSISFHGPYRFFSLTASEEKWNKMVEDFEEVILLAEFYNVEFIVLHTNEVIDYQVKKEIVESRIDFLIKKAKNIKIAVENVGIKKNMLYNEEEYVSLIKNKKLYSLIDIGHALLNNWDLEKVISNLQTNILAYHLHNNFGEKDSHQSVFEGKYNYNKIFEMIRKYTPNSNLVLEYNPTVKEEILIEDLEKINLEVNK